MPARTHGHCRHWKTSPEYKSWDSAKQRCLNPKNSRYSTYGGRGIRFHEPWIHDFQAFVNYMGPRRAGTTLDRIDVNGHYEPGNVRWATARQQYSNMRNNATITWNGRTQSIHAWAHELGVLKTTLYCRVFKRGWNIDRAMTNRNFRFKAERATRAETPTGI